MIAKSTTIITFAFLVLLSLGLQSPEAHATGDKRASERHKVTKKSSVRPVAVAASKFKPKAIVYPRSKEKKLAKRPGNSRRDLSTSARGSDRRLKATHAPPVKRPSFGQLAGLDATTDSLGLKSNAVLVIDQNTQEVLFSKNGSTVLPIASLTKIMTGLIIADAGLSLTERITITEDDVDNLKGSGSRLAVGAELTRGELLHLALMSSENRAAHALGRTFPGGLSAFIRLMNVKAQLLGMEDTQYVDPTGLSPRNQSSAKDMAALATEAYHRPIIRDLSTSIGYEVDTGRKTLQYRNTNRLVSNPEWDIGLQKTGYISEAGRCLVMQAKVAGRELIMVFLDSAGKLTRLADAERVRRWIETK